MLGPRSEDKVVSLTDCLAIGPIAGGSFDERERWFDAHIPEHQGWDWLTDSADNFLSTIRRWRGDRLVWIAPRSACEQCGLQWYFEQIKDAASGPMIVVDQPIPFKRLTAVPLGLGELANDYMADLLNSAPRRQWPAELSSPVCWQRLRSDGKLLRVVEDGRLKSVETDHFDRMILDHTPAEWTKWAHVVGYSMVEAMELGHHTGDIFYIWRLRELVQQGLIACEGELPGREHDAERRPTAMLRRVG